MKVLVEIVKKIWVLPLLVLLPSVLTKLEGRGWLGQLVAYHKKKFLEDLARIPTPITVTVEEAPEGYVDPPGWDWQSALRLVALVEVLDAAPAQRAINEALGPTRRFYLPPYKKNSWRMFPSLSKHIANDFEYDMVQYDDQVVIDNMPFKRFENETATVLYISNPVEARLPGARITVKLLKDILENRAKGLRVMPTTTGYSHSWVTGATGAKKAPAEKQDGASAADDATSVTLTDAGDASDAGASDAGDASEASDAGDAEVTEATEATEAEE